MEIQWKPIKDYENLYLISNIGNVYSIKRKKFLKPFIDKDGYSKVNLQDKGRILNISIHRIVAETFIPNPNNLPFVLHKKSILNGGNNSVDNLYWGTPLENMKDKIRDGHSALSQKINQYDMQHNFIRQWDCIADASRELGIHREQISRVCRRCPKRKSTHNFIFEYANS